MVNEPADEPILRAKYLDWCSARVVDRFLELTPDQIYQLAHEHSWRETAHTAGGARAVTTPPGGTAGIAGTGAGAAPFVVPGGHGAGEPVAGGRALDGGESYRELVARVTEVLAARIGLPSFEAWVAEYERAPEQFDAELLGLWKRDA
ncbi:MAG TPA: hypothetical protein VF212_10615 [Longimicrobiales bacterium]